MFVNDFLIFSLFVILKILQKKFQEISILRNISHMCTIPLTLQHHN